MMDSFQKDNVPKVHSLQKTNPFQDEDEVTDGLAFSTISKRKNFQSGEFIEAVSEKRLISGSKPNASLYGRVPYYDHFLKPKGLVLIINNYFFEKAPNRKGSDKDYKDIMDLFHDTLGFDMFTHWDLTGSQMMEAMNSFIQFAENRREKYDSLAVVVMTHGELGLFYGTDDQKVDENKFLKPLQRNKHLRDKPKLFFLQACRCRSEDEKNSGGDHGLCRPAAGPNSFVFHASSPGEYALRNEKCGSRFIQKLCASVKRDAHEGFADIHFLARAIREEVSKVERNGKQSPTITDNLLKKFHFFPIENIFGV